MKRNEPVLQLALLFTSNFSILFVGMGLFPLLPVYAERFGANRSVMGMYYAIIALSNAMGPLVVGWLAGRISRKSLFAASGVLGMAALALMSWSASLWQAVALTSVVWFVGGVNLSLSNIFTGLYAQGNSRGKVFSLMSLAMPLGALAGGAGLGKLLDWKGFETLFLALAGLWVVLPIVGVWMLKEPVVGLNVQPDRRQRAGASRLETAALLLMGVSMLAGFAINLNRIGISFSMQALHFSPGEISSASMVSGLVAMPVIFLLGSLSDRIGRRHALLLVYLSAATGGVSLMAAREVWHYWLASSLALVSFCLSGAMASAVMTDLLTPDALSGGLPKLNMVNSLAGVLSSAGSGYLMEALGGQALFLAAAILPVIAAAILEVRPHAAAAAPSLQPQCESAGPVAPARLVGRSTGWYDRSHKG